MEEAIIYYLSWPVLLYILYKFTDINLRHFNDLERLAAYDKQAVAQDTTQQSVTQDTVKQSTAKDVAKQPAEDVAEESEAQDTAEQSAVEDVAKEPKAQDSKE